MVEYFRQLYGLPTRDEIDAEKFRKEVYETYDGPPEAEDLTSEPKEAEEMIDEEEEGEESSSSSSSAEEETSDGYDTDSSDTWSSLYGSSWESGRELDDSANRTSSSDEEPDHSVSKN